MLRCLVVTFIWALTHLSIYLEWIHKVTAKTCLRRRTTSWEATELRGGPVLIWTKHVNAGATVSPYLTQINIKRRVPCHTSQLLQWNFILRLLKLTVSSALDPSL